MQVAVACIKVASQAVSTMPSLFFFPILPFIMTTCLIIYWVAVAGYLYSAGDVIIKTVQYSASNALTLSVSTCIGTMIAVHTYASASDMLHLPGASDRDGLSQHLCRASVCLVLLTLTSHAEHNDHMCALYLIY